MGAIHGPVCCSRPALEAGRGAEYRSRPVLTGVGRVPCERYQDRSRISNSKTVFSPVSDIENALILERRPGIHSDASVLPTPAQQKDLSGFSPFRRVHLCDALPPLLSITAMTPCPRACSSSTRTSATLRTHHLIRLIGCCQHLHGTDFLRQVNHCRFVVFPPIRRCHRLRIRSLFPLPACRSSVQRDGSRVGSVAFGLRFLRGPAHLCVLRVFCRWQCLLMLMTRKKSSRGAIVEIV